MIKHHCDICGKELTAQEVWFSMEMIGNREYCSDHVPDWVRKPITFIMRYPDGSERPYVKPVGKVTAYIDGAHAENTDGGQL